MAYKKPPAWLAHHGIEGQKWGVSNEPPYPLGSNNVSTGNSIKKGARVKTILKTTTKGGDS